MNNILFFIQDSNILISFNKKELKYLKSKLLQQYDFQTKDYFFRTEVKSDLSFYGFSVWAKINLELSELIISHIRINQITELIKQIDTIIRPMNLREVEI